MFNRPITTGFAAFFTLLAATQYSAAVDANDFANKLLRTTGLPSRN